MTENIYVFPDKNIIETEAGEWLVRLDGDTRLSEDELIKLRDWLDRSPAHREELSNLLRFYDRMNILTELSVPLERQVAGKPTSNERPVTWTGLIRFAFSRNLAVIALALVALALIINQQAWEPGASEPGTNGIYSTTIGEQSSVSLSDGSTIHLNTNSQVKVEYEETVRNVRLLQGEAFFNVAKIPQRPFHVYAGTGRVEAVSTAFIVRLNKHGVDVVVTEGSVKLAALKKLPGRQAVSKDNHEHALGTLDAGQGTTIRALITDEENVSFSTMELVQNLDEAELSRRLSWRHGLLIFTGDPLEDVIDEISRYSPVTIEIIDPTLKAIRIGGQFRVGDVEAMLASLETNFHLRIIRLRHDYIQIASAE
ncbi:MAG: FecR domain-containing protein [Gammaproteobacteria bacterium]|nr:FecR domain-containing protein [Gammaproteobacteria bacterium]MDE0286553.1 FecR domain-containing protein [Gammaproteobacteria bacterium]